MIPGRAAGGDEQRAARVAASHEIVRRAFVAGAAFGAVAVVWAARVLVAGGSWWGPLHAFLAGTVLLAISGTTQMFTVTWSAAVPPPRRWVVVQRWLVTGGVGAVLTGVGADLAPLTWLGGLATASGLVLLAGLIHRTVRRSLLRRFDLSSRFYLVAAGCGTGGVLLGTLMGTGTVRGGFADVRLVHAHLNLVGLVGLTIIGTLPTLLPTTAYHRAVSGREAVVAWWLGCAGAALIGAGLVAPSLVGLGTLMIAGGGAAVLGGILWRLGGEGRRTIMFIQIAVGTVWLLGWATADGIRVLSGRPTTPFSGWTAAAVVAGVAQVLIGALTYLIPVVKGRPFPPNRAVMEARPWLGLVALNAAGMAVGLGALVPAAALVGVWLVDFAGRVLVVATGRATAGVRGGERS